MNYTCPSCGFDQLDQNPYENMPTNPHPITVKPPYENHWGKPSYDCCPCCGFEFGADDNNPGADNKGYTFESYRNIWITEDNHKWLEEEQKPSNWSLDHQLNNIGATAPKKSIT